MGKIHYFSVVLFFFVPLILEAQKVMNLEECLQIGLENN